MYAHDKNKFKRFKKAVQTDPFIRYVLTNIDSSLASSDEEIFSMYVRLASDVSQSGDFFSVMTAELARTRRMIDFILEAPISKRRENHYYSTLLRAEAMEPLHQHQIKLLEGWRKNTKQKNSGGSDRILSELLRCINAIAGAIGFTG